MNKPHNDGGGVATELRIIVWQFVRIMVQLETVARATEAFYRGDDDRPTSK